jgi:hypothetical protein
MAKEINKKEILDKLKSLMFRFTPPLVAAKQSDSGFELIGNIETEYGSKKQLVPGMYFASTAIRTSSVVFYFFPIYMNEKPFKEMAPNTIKLLKGKTCFHFKRIEEINEKEINLIFEAGIAFYKTKNWLE